MKNNTKEVQQLKQQILDLTDQVEALQMLIYFHEMEGETKKLNTCKDYRIEFKDQNQKELWCSIVTAVDMADATGYAHKLMAGGSQNDLTTFEIIEL